MARKPRFVLPGVPQHLIQRGRDGQPCFFNTLDYCLLPGNPAASSE